MITEKNDGIFVLKKMADFPHTLCSVPSVRGNDFPHTLCSVPSVHGNRSAFLRD